MDGDYPVEIYIHLLDLIRNSCEKCNNRSLAGIEPAALRFRCSALTKILIYTIDKTHPIHILDSLILRKLQVL